MSAVIEVRGLTVRYGSFTAVDDVDLAVGEHDAFGLDALDPAQTNHVPDPLQLGELSPGTGGAAGCSDPASRMLRCCGPAGF